MISSLELARICGVSQGTVDRALHGRPGVSDATKARILAAASEHGYVANPSMRELLSGESSLVGGVVPSINSPFFMDLMQEAANICSELNFRLLLTPVRAETDFQAALAEFAARRFRGALVVPPFDYIKLATAASFRVASFIGPCIGGSSRAFLPDEVETGRTATNYLLAHGHTKIVHVTYGRRQMAIAQRAEGYEQALQARGLPAQIHVGVSGDLFAGMLEGHSPTAILCHNDWLALDVIRRANSLGLRVPEDLSVMGVDDSRTFAALYPGIATMHYPMAELAADAVRWMLTGDEPEETRNATIKEGGTVRRLIACDTFQNED